MPAHGSKKSLPMALVGSLARTLVRSFMAAHASNECFVWAGPFADAERNHPVAMFVLRREKVSLRPLLCQGSGGQVVMTCKTAGCVNPRHMQRVVSARPRKICQAREVVPGKGSVFAPKTTAISRAEILSALDAGATQSSVAKRFGVSQSTVSRIKRSA